MPRPRSRDVPLGILLFLAGCPAGNDGPTGDDDTTADESEPFPCGHGYILDPDLPAEYVETFADGCVPAACGIGQWGNLRVDGDTLFVDARASSGGDGSQQAPFTSMQDGLDAAADRGARVVVATGTYAENLVVGESHDGMYLAGRCRELVVLDGKGGGEDESGIRADGVMGDEEWWVSGLTVTGAPKVGIWLETGSLHVQSVAVLDNQGVGILAALPSSTLSLADVEVRDTHPYADGTSGHGIQVVYGASLEAVGCLLESNTEAGIMVGQEGTTVWLSDLEVRDTRRASLLTVATALVSQEGAFVTASDVIADRTDGPGLFVATGMLSCSGCELTNNTFAGALAWAGGSLDLSATIISNTLPDAAEGGGIGIFASDWRGPSALSVENTLIQDQPYAAIWLEGDGSYSIRSSTLVGGYGEEVEHFDGSTSILNGDGVVVTNGVEGLLLENNLIHDAVRAGVLLDGSSAHLSGNTFAGNSTDLVWQDCEGVDEPAGLEDVSDYDDRCSLSTLPIAPLDFDLYLEEAEIAE